MKTPGKPMWEKVEAILDGALDRVGPERESFIREMSGDDKAVLKEVLGILSALDQSDKSFLDKPAASAFGWKDSDPLSRVRTHGSVSHYEVEELVGEGGMGIVYKACDTELGRTVALKFLPGWTIGNPELSKRFHLEARAASMINHPNICTVYEYAREGDVAFIVMEYVEGRSLKDIIAEGDLEPGRMMDLANQICAGLAAAHQEDIVHRDIKPSNIKVRPDGVAKILDFGLVKVLTDATLTRGPMKMGSVRYMSPEQIRGERVDQRADVWSFGVVLYEILTGRHPFGEKEGIDTPYLVQTTPPVPPGDLNPALAEGFDALLAKLLATRPADRPANAGEVADELAKLSARLDA